MKPPHGRAAVQLFAHDELRPVGGNAGRGRLADARRVRRGRLDELDRANAPVALRDFGLPLSDEQLGDARRNAPQVLAVGLEQIDAWIEGAGRVTLILFL